MRLPAHYFTETDPTVAHAIARLAADPEYWEALREAEEAASAVRCRLTPEKISARVAVWKKNRKERIRAD